MAGRSIGRKIRKVSKTAARLAARSWSPGIPKGPPKTPKPKKVIQRGRGAGLPPIPSSGLHNRVHASKAVTASFPLSKKIRFARKTGLRTATAQSIKANRKAHPKLKGHKSLTGARMPVYSTHSKVTAVKGGKSRVSRLFTPLKASGYAGLKGRSATLVRLSRHKGITKSKILGKHVFK